MIAYYWSRKVEWWIYHDDTSDHKALMKPEDKPRVTKQGS
jgi:hypothetical protein